MGDEMKEELIQREPKGKRRANEEMSFEDDLKLGDKYRMTRMRKHLQNYTPDGVPARPMCGIKFDGQRNE